MIDALHPALAHHVVNSLGWRDLRPLQGEAIEPLLAGRDALLLAPTAGGKTEAAMFPLLTAMERDRWTGVSVLYVCPLKALLNNLVPRLTTYASWLGRTVAVWHGDVAASARQRILRERPDVLLTTPESIEAMLVSTKVEHRRSSVICAPWWSMRSTPSPATTAGGTCLPFSNGSPGSAATRRSGSGCPRPSATRRSC